MPATSTSDLLAECERACASLRGDAAAARNRVAELERLLAESKRQPAPIVYQNPPDTRDLDRMRRAMKLVSDQHRQASTWVRMIEQVYNLELSGENLNVDVLKPL